MVNNVVADVGGLIELKKFAMTSGILEGHEILSAVCDRIERVSPSVQPNRWPIIIRSAQKQFLIDWFGEPTTLVDPPPYEIEDP